MDSIIGLISPLLYKMTELGLLDGSLHPPSLLFSYRSGHNISKGNYRLILHFELAESLLGENLLKLKVNLETRVPQEMCPKCEVFLTDFHGTKAARTQGWIRELKVITN